MGHPSAASDYLNDLAVVVARAFRPELVMLGLRREILAISEGLLMGEHGGTLAGN